MTREQPQSRVSSILQKSNLPIKIKYFLILNCFLVIVLLTQESPTSQLQLVRHKRKLSVDSEERDHKQCVWDSTIPPIGQEEEIARTTPFKTLIASYPGSGVRLTSLQSDERILGIQLEDNPDRFLEETTTTTTTTTTEAGHLVNTHYPHPEGSWRWGNHMDQTILLIRNPRWAIPHYHKLLSKKNLAHDWINVIFNLKGSFSMRPPDSQWIQWRDRNFDDELKLWRWQIDFWMRGGTQYWIFDRGHHGQVHQPFFHQDETDENRWPHDVHCNHPIDCHAHAVVSYENLQDPSIGPFELRRLAHLIRAKMGFGDGVSDEEIRCQWSEIINEGEINDEDIPIKNNYHASNPQESTFTNAQLRRISESLQIMINKYSSEEWIENPLAQNLLEYFHSYMDELTIERKMLKRKTANAFALDSY